MSQLLSDWRAKRSKQQGQPHEKQQGPPHVSVNTVFTGGAMPAAVVGPWYRDAAVVWDMGCSPMQGPEYMQVKFVSNTVPDREAMKLLQNQRNV